MLVRMNTIFFLFFRKAFDANNIYSKILKSGLDYKNLTQM